MAQWMTKKVQLALPTEVAVDMFLHAHQGDRERGGRYEGRYDPCGVAIRIGPANHEAGERPTGPHGEADFHWRQPSDGEVTLYRIGWDPLAGGSEDLVWGALETLAGQPIQPAVGVESYEHDALPRP